MFNDDDFPPLNEKVSVAPTTSNVAPGSGNAWFRAPVPAPAAPSPAPFEQHNSPSIHGTPSPPLIPTIDIDCVGKEYPDMSIVDHEEEVITTDGGADVAEHQSVDQPDGVEPDLAATVTDSVTTGSLSDEPTQGPNDSEENGDEEEVGSEHVEEEHNARSSTIDVVYRQVPEVTIAEPSPVMVSVLSDQEFPSLSQPVGDYRRYKKYRIPRRKKQRLGEGSEDQGTAADEQPDNGEGPEMPDE